ncbi:MAG TPA: hypothetical protein VM307_14585 [Egibacteraceae bacterium]|nr:hypothetical protein [Egibacteraceae bacterium]
MAGAPDLASRGTPREVMARHRDVVERLAKRHGLSHVRVTDGGLVLVTADSQDVSYATLSRFEEDLAHALDVDVEAYTDDVLTNPGHTEALDTAQPL